MIEVALGHHYPGFALDIAFAAPTPGTTVLFGASGAGKSSIVAGIAGLLRPDFARVSVNGATLEETGRVRIPVERRRLGVVFQDSRLFPHLSVLDNLRYGLRRADRPSIELGDVVGLLGLAGLLARRPHQLSGGERQRVAIGRALLAQPRLLLMDEPLASLDMPRKAEILPYIARLPDELGLPIIYVTHAVEEMTYLADTVVLLAAGRVAAVGPLAQLTARGDLPLLADRDDAGSVLAAVVAEHDPGRGLTLLRSGSLAVWVPQLAVPPGTRLRLRVPAREIILATEPPGAVSVHNVIGGRVRSVTADRPHAALIELEVGEATLLARITRDAVARLSLAPGAPAFALVKSVSIIVIGVP